MIPEPLVLERTYRQPAEVLWKALTDVDSMRQWYFDVDDFRPELGFRFQFAGQGKEGQAYIHRCQVTHVVPLRVIAYTWAYEGFEGQSELHFELFPEAQGTRLVLTHSGLQTFPPLPDFRAENFREGWTWFLDEGLPGFLEKA
jgi:uncharacterized protein YndB with AHSA1/START domain